MAQRSDLERALLEAQGVAALPDIPFSGQQGALIAQAGTLAAQAGALNDETGAPSSETLLQGQLATFNGQLANPSEKVGPFATEVSLQTQLAASRAQLESPAVAPGADSGGAFPLVAPPARSLKLPPAAPKTPARDPKSLAPVSAPRVEEPVVEKTDVFQTQIEKIVSLQAGRDWKEDPEANKKQALLVQFGWEAKKFGADEKNAISLVENIYTPRNASQLYAILPHFFEKYGEFNETCLFDQFQNGRIDLKQFLGQPVAAVKKDLETIFSQRKTKRDLCRANFYSYFMQIIKDDDPKRLRKNVQELSRQLERSLYNAIINHCMQSTTGIVRSWKSTAFVALYQEKMVTLCAHLDHNSSLSQSYTFTHAADLYQAFVQSQEENISESFTKVAESFCAKTATELCPEAFEEEIRYTDTRKKQVVSKKVSKMWHCPNCGGRKCEYEEVQDRSGDEAGSIYCSCLLCGHAFKAS